MQDRPLVIGIGVGFAGDDAAGRQVTRAGPRGIDFAECHGVAADMVPLMSGRGRVVIVNVCTSAATRGIVQMLDGLADSLPLSLRSVSRSGNGMVGGIALAQALGQMPMRITTHVIEGVIFAVGALPKSCHVRRSGRGGLAPLQI